MTIPPLSGPQGFQSILGHTERRQMGASPDSLHFAHGGRAPSRQRECPTSPRKGAVPKDLSFALRDVALGPQTRLTSAR
jgi:hypothetical protein